MRLSRGSGLTGLVGMRPERDRSGIRHVRPLLDCSKASLMDLCRQEDWAFVTDPSNADEHYARVRWRKIMPALAGEGLTTERLATLAHRVGRAEEALDLKAAEALLRANPSSTVGGLTIEASVLADEPFEIALRVLVKSLLGRRPRPR